MNQYEVFSQQQADQWFERNKNFLSVVDCENDLCSQFLKNNIPVDEVSSIIELGASDGYRLDFLKKIFPNCSRIVGTDLSQKAVEEGRARYGITMYKAGIEDILDEEPFDLVIVNGVLCWVDRNNLFKTFYCIDKLVNNNKYLCIGDFCPFYPQKNEYHHIQDEKVYTYKQDYTQIFLASQNYQLLQKVYHAGRKLENNLAEENEKLLTQYDRRCISILHKNISAYYF